MYIIRWCFVNMLVSGDVSRPSEVPWPSCVGCLKTEVGSLPPLTPIGRPLRTPRWFRRNRRVPILSVVVGPKGPALYSGPRRLPRLRVHTGIIVVQDLPLFVGVVPEEIRRLLKVTTESHRDRRGIVYEKKKMSLVRCPGARSRPLPRMNLELP